MHYKLFGFKKGELGESSDLYYTKKEALAEMEEFTADFPCVLLIYTRDKMFYVIQNTDRYGTEEMKRYWPHFKIADLMSDNNNENNKSLAEKQSVNPMLGPKTRILTNLFIKCRQFISGLSANKKR